MRESIFPENSEHWRVDERHCRLMEVCEGAKGLRSGRAEQIGQSGWAGLQNSSNDADGIIEDFEWKGKKFWLLWNWKKTLNRLEGSWVRGRHDKSYALERLTMLQSLSHVWLFATPWIAACQASLSITNSWSSPKLMSIELVLPSSFSSPSPAPSPSQHQGLFQ